MKTPISRKTTYTIEEFLKNRQWWAKLPGLQCSTRSSLLKQVGELTAEYIKGFSKFRIVKTYTSVTKESPMKFRDIHKKYVTPESQITNPGVSSK